MTGHLRADEHELKYKRECFFIWKDDNILVENLQMKGAYSNGISTWK